MSVPYLKRAENSLYYKDGVSLGLYMLSVSLTPDEKKGVLQVWGVCVCVYLYVCLLHRNSETDDPILFSFLFCLKGHLFFFYSLFSYYLRKTAVQKLPLDYLF